MLQLYLSTIIVWMIILYCTVKLCAEKIVANGWTKGVGPSSMGPWMSLFVISAAPIFRVFAFIMLFYMASETKEHFEEVMNNYREDD